MPAKPMLALAQRRKRELDLKLASLEAEFAAWATRTTTEPMRRHYSQVARLTRTLTAFLSSMTTSAGWKDASDEVVLAKAIAWEKRILSAHAIWEVFRSKLMQRSDPFFQEHLFAYDDLAWACYEPAMKRYATVAKEPPLVYLNSTWSAFLRRRDVSFESEVLKGKDAGAALNQEEYQETIRKLPVPLLGLPWFQASHAPSALLIAHEVGHAVEFDFNLTSTIDQALLAAGLANAPDWRRCAAEVFADVYGCLCLGRYFSGALLDLLVADPQVVAQDDVFGDYPPRAYRVELAAATLSAVGQDAAATHVRQTWQAVYGQGELPPSGKADVTRIVNAIAGDGGMNMKAIMTPPADVAALAQYAAQGNRTEVGKQADARVLFCALRDVYENRPAADFHRAAPLLLTQVVTKNGVAFRYRSGQSRTQQDVDTALDGQADADAAAGKDLEKILGLDGD